MAGTFAGSPGQRRAFLRQRAVAVGRAPTLATQAARRRPQRRRAAATRRRRGLGHDASADGRRDEATDGGRDSGGASSEEKRTADVARETRAADGGTRGGGAAFLRCEKTSDKPEAAAATPDASPPNSATSVAKAFTTRRSRFSRKVRLL